MLPKVNQKNRGTPHGLRRSRNCEIFKTLQTNLIIDPYLCPVPFAGFARNQVVGMADKLF